MNNNKLYSMLLARTNDLKGAKFPASVREAALNNALGQTCLILNSGYLTELQEKSTAIDPDTPGTSIYSINTDNFTDGVLGDYIIVVKVTGGKYAKQINISEAKQLEGIYTSGMAEYPRFFLFGNKIHLFAGNTAPQIDVFFLKKPADIVIQRSISGGSTTTNIVLAVDTGEADDFFNGKLLLFPTLNNAKRVVSDYVKSTKTITLNTALDSAPTSDDHCVFINSDGLERSSDESTAPLLNPAFHEIVLSLAEAELWAMDGGLDRNSAAYQSGIDKITLLNSQYQKAVGVGTNR